MSPLSVMSGFTRALSTLRSVKPTLRTFSFTSACRQKPWKVLRLNHIAIATSELEKMSKFYADVLGMKTSGSKPLPSHGVTTVFVDARNTKFELLLPLGENSPIQTYLQKNKSGGMHHICLEVDDIWAAIEDLKKKKIHTLSQEPSPGAHGKLVIFLHPKDCGGVLIELEQA